MNKLIGIPLAFIILLSFVSLISDPTFEFTGVQEYENRTVWNDTSRQFETVEMPVGDKPANFSTFDGVIIMLAGAVAIGIIAGIQIMGSGLSETSQELTIAITFYGCIWAIFSIIAYGILEDMTTLGPLLWTGLTIMYAIGFIQNIAASGDA